MLEYNFVMLAISTDVSFVLQLPRNHTDLVSELFLRYVLYSNLVINFVCGKVLNAFMKYNSSMSICLFSSRFLAKSLTVNISCVSALLVDPTPCCT